MVVTQSLWEKQHGRARQVFRQHTFPVIAPSNFQSAWTFIWEIRWSKLAQLSTLEFAWRLSWSAACLTILEHLIRMIPLASLSPLHEGGMSPICPKVPVSLTVAQTLKRYTGLSDSINASISQDPSYKIPLDRCLMILFSCQPCLVLLVTEEQQTHLCYQEARCRWSR